jgi:hypothetical protein
MVCKELSEESIKYMQVQATNCWQDNAGGRRCKHFRGFKQFPGELGAPKAICTAFPSGIPIRITYGADLHEEIERDQVGTDIFEQWNK